MSVRQAQREIDSAEFSEWVAFYTREPFGTERDNIHAGIISCAVLASQGAKNVKVEDFMLKLKEEEKMQTPEQMQAVLQMFTNWFNG